MIRKIVEAFHLSICAVLIFQLVGCGTIMYPERKGQKGGKIDAGVAVLDGIGLLFFLIPGIIAYVVDFNNGTIYLPNSWSSLDSKDMRQVKFDPRQSSMARIEEIVKYETGYDVRSYEGVMKIYKLESSEDMRTHFAQALPEIESAHRALFRK